MNRKILLLICIVLLILISVCICGAGLIKSHTDSATPVKNFYSQMQLVEVCTAIPGTIFTQMTNRGLSGNDNFQSTPMFDSGTSLYSIYKCSAGSGSWTRKFEIFSSINVTVTASAQYKVFECVWNSDKSEISYTMDIATYGIGFISGQSMLQVDMEKTTTVATTEIRMVKLGNGNPDAYYLKLNKNSDNTYDAVTTIIFPSDFSETSLRGNAIIAKARVSTANIATIGLKFVHKTDSSVSISGTDTVDPSNFFSGSFTGYPAIWYSDATSVNISAVSNAPSLNDNLLSLEDPADVNTMTIPFRF